MRIYQSSISTTILNELYKRSPDTKINVLRSYRANGPETLRLIKTHPPNINSMILDSGVWGLNQGTLKHKSTVITYYKFLERNKDKFDFYFNFDEKFDGDPLEVNWKNQVFLEKHGLNPIPVIHSYAEEEINHYLSLRNKYEKIAFGSGLHSDEKKLKETVDLFYNNGFKVHVFAYGSYKRLNGLKAWSTDCSSFARWISVGRVIFYSKILDKEVVFSFLPENKSGKINNDYIYSCGDDKKEDVINEYESYIYKNLKLTINDLSAISYLRTVANSFYFSELEKIITEKQKNNSIKFNYW